MLPALFGVAVYTSNGSVDYYSAAALDAHYRLISGSNPAVPGQIIALFGTGLGATTLSNGLAKDNVIPDVQVDGINVS